MTVAELTARISVIGDKAVLSSFRSVATGAKSMADSILRTTGALALMGKVQESAARVSGIQAAISYDNQVRGLAAYATNAGQLTAQLERLRDIAKLPGLGLSEVRQGVLALEAAGLSANMSERALKGFGNALALAGRGKADLDGVILALGQIASKGQISAEEINQIAERVPQIRGVLQSAFGTSSTEAIQKMGLSATQAIELIIQGLERLPKATGGAQVSFENLADAFDQAVLPIGRGLLDMFMSTEKGATSLVGMLGQLGTLLGEVFSAVGKSGAIQSALDQLMKGMTGVAGGWQQGMAKMIASTLAFVSYIPELWRALVTDLNAIWTIGIDNMKIALDNFIGLASDRFGVVVDEIKNLFNEVAKIFNFFSRQFQIQFPGIGVMGKGGIQTLPDIKAPKTAFIPTPFKEFPGGGPFGQTRDAFGRMQEFARVLGEGIIGKLGPQGLPDGLIYGGAKTAEQAQKTQNLLKSIDGNTRSAAESLDLRRMTLGGGAMGQIGITAAELAGGADSGRIRFGDFLGGGDQGLIPAGTELERAVRRMIRGENRKAGIPGVMRRF